MPTQYNKTQRFPDLAPKQVKALLSLLDGQSVSKAASIVGVDRATCSGWLNQAGPFRDAYVRLQRELWVEVMGTLRSGVLSASQVLVEIVQDKSIPANQRIRAAETILKTLGVKIGGISPPTDTDVFGDDLDNFMDSF